MDRRIAVAALLTALASAAGCVASGPPAALRHIGTPTVVRSSTQEARLVAELRQPALGGSRYTPAEQIAVYAGYELENGNEWDAALLLSIASYRYHQQAYLALAKGNAQSHTINPASMDRFREWVGNEVKLFNDQHFDEELDLLRQHLFGFSVAVERRDAYLRQIARGGKEDAAFDQQLTDLQTEMSNRTERLAHPALAHAFLARLVQDHSRDPKNSFAFYYLAATPLDRFRLAALDGTMGSFNITLARNLVPRMRTLRPYVRERLESHRVYTRAMAAAMLGLAPDPADVALLEARLARENNGMVIDSIRFALIQNGKESHLAELVARAGQQTAQEEREHTLAMLLWLPAARKIALDEAFFVRLARNEPGISKLGRITALAMLRAMAQEKALAQESVIAVLELTADPDAHVASTAATVVGSLEQLGAAECKALYQRYPRARAALVTRLREVASLGDLDFLSQAYDTASDFDLRLAAAGAVASIPGTASLQLLRRWLADTGRNPDTTPFLSLVGLLSMRADIDQADLDGLKLPRAKRLMIEMALNSKDLARTATSLEVKNLRTGASLDHLDLLDALQITLLSGMLQRPALAGTLWKLARYRNDALYPGDAVVRRQALAALVRMELRRRTERSARAVANR